MRRTILSIILATLWISFSEFARNELLLKSFWTEHYEQMGLTFPSDPVNGAVWGIWSLMFAVAIFILSKKFKLVETTLLAWLMAFVMMWIVIGNMAVLPYGILLFAVPLSLIEAFIATLLIKKMNNTRSSSDQN